MSSTPRRRVDNIQTQPSAAPTGIIYFNIELVANRLLNCIGAGSISRYSIYKYNTHCLIIVFEELRQRTAGHNVSFKPAAESYDILVPSFGENVSENLFDQVGVLCRSKSHTSSSQCSPMT
jgi:hypothetical protein